MCDLQLGNLNTRKLGSEPLNDMVNVSRHARMANAAHQWRRATGAEMITEARPRRPLHVPGSRRSLDCIASLLQFSPKALEPVCPEDQMVIVIRESVFDTEPG
jgi:hypothetical protein